MSLPHLDKVELVKSRSQEGESDMDLGISEEKVILGGASVKGQGGT
jgi:hypothetical protein